MLNTTKKTIVHNNYYTYFIQLYYSVLNEIYGTFKLDRICFWECENYSFIYLYKPDIKH